MMVICRTCYSMRNTVIIPHCLTCLLMRSSNNMGRRMSCCPKNYKSCRNPAWVRLRTAFLWYQLLAEGKQDIPDRKKVLLDVGRKSPPFPLPPLFLFLWHVPGEKQYPEQLQEEPAWASPVCALQTWDLSREDPKACRLCGVTTELAQKPEQSLTCRHELYKNLLLFKLWVTVSCTFSRSDDGF